MKLSPTTVKNEARKEFFGIMKELFDGYEVHVIGDSELAIKIGNAPTGESIYATLSPTVKDYCERKTKTKTIHAFDVHATASAYSQTLDKRAEKSAENAQRKAAKIERDTAARERIKAEREKKLNK